MPKSLESGNLSLSQAGIQWMSVDLATRHGQREVQTMYRFTLFATLIVGLCMPALAQGPAIAVREANPAGEADVVVTGGLKGIRLWYFWATPKSPWGVKDIPDSAGNTFSAPAIAARGANPLGEVDVVAQGPGHSLRYYWVAPGSNSQWNSTEILGSAGMTSSAPAIAVRTANPPGEADVVAQTPTNSLRYYWAKPGEQWNSTEILGSAGMTSSAPAIGIREANPPGGGGGCRADADQ